LLKAESFMHFSIVARVGHATAENGYFSGKSIANTINLRIVFLMVRAGWIGIEKI